MAIPTWAKQTTLMTILGTLFTAALVGFLYLVYTQHLVVPVAFGITMPMVYIPIIATIVSAIATSFFWLVGMKFLHVALLRKLNKAENASLSAEVQTDKVKQLEAQVHTLETALSKALKV
jgi:fructose-specific phosphotransferase system IIC component